MFTDSESRLIERCIAEGYGRGAFAASVKASGKCTEKQFETMQRLTYSAEYRKNNPPRRSSRQTSLDSAFCDYSDGGDF